MNTRRLVCIVALATVAFTTRALADLTTIDTPNDTTHVSGLFAVAGYHKWTGMTGRDSDNVLVEMYATDANGNQTGSPVSTANPTLNRPNPMVTEARWSGQLQAPPPPATGRTKYIIKVKPRWSITPNGDPDTEPNTIVVYVGQQP